jgi:hypothetical protein
VNKKPNAVEETMHVTRMTSKSSVLVRWTEQPDDSVTLARKGLRFSQSPATTEQAKYIRDLVKQNPGLKPMKLFVIADKRVLGSMSKDAFRKHVRSAPSIPLATVIKHEGFKRNLDFLVRDPTADPKLVAALKREFNSKQSKGRQFVSGRREGAITDKTKHIRGLVKDDPAAPARTLWCIADKKIIGSMTFGTFANQVSRAKKTRAR